MKHTLKNRQLFYKGTNGVPSWCWIDAYEDRTNIVRHIVFTEPNEDSGMSVTNAAEEVIKRAIDVFFPYQRTTGRWPTHFYERYIYPEGTTVDEIEVDWLGKNPKWHRILTPPWKEDE